MIAIFHKLRKGAIKYFAIGALGLTAACDPSAMISQVSAPSGPIIDTSKPVQVALLVPKSSSFGGDGVLSRSAENAARMAVQDLNANAQIDLRVYDTGGTEQGSGAAAAKAVAEGAAIIVGPIRTGNTIAASLAVAGTDVKLLSLSNNPAAAGGNVYILGNTFRTTANRLVSYAQSQGRKRIMVIHARDVAGEAGRDAVMAALTKAGLTPAGVNAYDLSQEGVIAAVPRIKATQSSTGADAIFLTSNTAGALPIFAELLPEAGINPATTQYMGLSRWDVPAATLALTGLQGGWFALPDPSKAAQFNARYTTTYGMEPHPLASIAYDGVAAVGAIIANGGKGGFGAANLTASQGFAGATGPFRFFADGTNERALAVAAVTNNSVSVISAAPSRFGLAGF